MSIKKVKANIANNRKYIAISIILWILVSYSMYLAFGEEWYAARIQPRYVDSFESISDKDEKSLALIDGVVVEQNIKIRMKEINGLSLTFNAEKLSKEGDILVELYQRDNEELVASWQREVSDISLGLNCDFVLSEIVPIEESGEYTIRVSATDIAKNSLSLSLAKVPQGQEIDMLVNGVPSEYAMEYRFIDGNYSGLRFLALAFYIGMTATIFAVVFLFVNRVRLEWIFVVFTLIIGGMYLFALPPYTVPDEAAHFVTTYAYSGQVLGEKTVDNSGKVIVEDERLWGVNNSYPKKSDYDNYLRGALGMTSLSGRKEISTRIPINVGIHGYFPQVIGVSVGRVLHFNPEQILLIGRVFSLIWYVFIMYWAIKLMPFGKVGLFSIGTLPMTMQMVVSYNYDAVLFGACFFAVAYLLHLIYRQNRVSVKDVALLSALGVTIAAIKFVYLPILGLALFVPKEKFKSNKNKILAGITVLSLSIITVLCSRVSTVGALMVPHATNSTNPGEAISMGYFLQNIGEMFKIYWRTFEHEISYYISGMIASPLGWLEIWLPDIIVFAFLFIILFSFICSDEEKDEVTKGMRNFSWLVAAFMLFLSLTALLFDCTSVEAKQIAGFQGRYLLPILTLLIVTLRNRNVVLKRSINKYVILFLSYLHCGVIFFITLTVIGR